MWGEYNFFALSAATLSAYGVSLALVEKKIITLLRHRKVWNVILLISFIGAGPLGMLMSFLIESGIRIPFYADVLWLHVESGIVMVIVAVFHAWWHKAYYRKENIKRVL